MCGRRLASLGGQQILPTIENTFSGADESFLEFPVVAHSDPGTSPSTSAVITIPCFAIELEAANS